MQTIFRKLRQGDLPWYVSSVIRVARTAWIYGWLPIAKTFWNWNRSRKSLHLQSTGRSDPNNWLPNDAFLTSRLCTQAEHESETFRSWVTKMGEAHKMSRKQWEFCYIAQGLFERGLLKPGSRGLGFAVGQEPLPSLFAGYGCEIVATDLAEEEAWSAGWVDTHQHASSLEMLNALGLCTPERFRDLVTFRVVDMNDIPSDLGGFDFVWSACALEHLGSIRKGEEFIYNAMKCLKPGGVAIHTTEYNLSFKRFTPDNCETVAFRRSDIERIADTLNSGGHSITLDLTEGDRSFDHFVDLPPYSRPHLKLMLFSAVYSCISTSIGLIIKKSW